MSQVSPSDNLLVIVDEINGQADPAMGGGSTGGYAVERGKIAYVKRSNDKVWMVGESVHEIGHNLGLVHQKDPSGNYMSYDANKTFLTPLQIIIANTYAQGGLLNKGQNSQRAIENSNFSNKTSNDRPYMMSTINQRIPLIVHNPTE